MSPASDSVVRSTYATQALPAPSSISLARVASWYRDGLRLWRRAPFLLLAVSLLPFVTEAMWQLLVPLAGTVLSKVFTPMAMSGQFVLLDRFAGGGGLRLADLLAGVRGRWILPLMGLGILSLVIFGTQLLVAWSFYGAPAIDAAVLGHLGKHASLATTRFLLTLILPGLIPAALLMFSIPLVILGGRSPVEAVRMSAGRVLGAPLAFTAYTLFGGAILAVSLATPPYVGLPLLLLSSTWMLTSGYVAYRDLFGGEDPRA